MTAMVIEHDARPEFRIAAFGMTQKLQRILEIVLRHAVHNRYRYVLTPRHGPGDFDIAMVDMTARGGVELARTLRRLSENRPVVTIGRRCDPTRVRDDLLQQQFTPQVLPTLNGTVERYRLLASAPGASASVPAAIPAPPVASVPQVVSASVTTNAARGAAGAAERPRALIVDDSPTVRHQLALALLRMGVDSEAVGTVRDARAALQTWRYDLAIIDVVMGDGDGFKLTREIRRNAAYKGLRLIILTGRSSPFDLARGALAGCHSYLVKPVTPQSLRETVLRNLSRAAEIRARSQAAENLAVVAEPAVR